MDKEILKEIEFVNNEALPTLFVDSLIMNIRSDDYCLLRLMTVLPEGMTEQSRVIIPKYKLKKMIDLLCSQCDYFPNKPKARLKAKIKKKSAGGAK